MQNFDYTGSEICTAFINEGYYKLELWGAGGKDAPVHFTAGRGGYVSGAININKSDSLYLYIGQSNTGDNTEPTYNGGGKGSTFDAYYASSGGGATDIRTMDGNWNAVVSLRSRIIVAGGGSGSLYRSNIAHFTSDSIYHGADGGGLIGYNGTYYKCAERYDLKSVATGGTQISGGIAAASYGYGSGTNGTFGVGGSGQTNFGSGAGGGWYGGGGGSDGSCLEFTGGGGSSYISGMSGSIGVTESGVAKCSAGSVSVACSESWTGYKFIAGTITMIDGAGHKWPEGSSAAETGYTQMPNPAGGYYASGVGHSGNGAARITYLGTTI